MSEDEVKENQPVNFSTLSTTEDGKLFGMATRYIAYCLDRDLITIVETKTGGRGRPSKAYALTAKGQKLTAARGGG